MGLESGSGANGVSGTAVVRTHRAHPVERGQLTVEHLGLLCHLANRSMKTGGLISGLPVEDLQLLHRKKDVWLRSTPIPPLERTDGVLVVRVEMMYCDAVFEPD